MGEYTMYKGERVKIGTCENMYYIRYEDRGKVTPVEDSINPAIELGLRWRLPFPDEDDTAIGQYGKYNRGEVLKGFTDPSTMGTVGLTQISHEMGLLINLPCYHGEKLPDLQGQDVKVFWNGKPDAYQLSAVKNTRSGIQPVVACRWCHTSWTYEWGDVLPYVMDTELKYRLENYIKETEVLEKTEYMQEINNGR